MKEYPTGELFSNIPKIINKYFEVYQKLITKHPHNTLLNSDPLQFKKLFIKLFNKIISDPDLIIKYQISFVKGQLETIEAIYQLYHKPDYNLFQNDKRFQNKIWQEHSMFNWIKNAYFTYTKWIDSVIEDLPKDDFSAVELKKLNFLIKQFIDAVAPSNFPATNPQVLQEFFDTSGNSFLHGLDNLFRDIENSTNTIWIKNNDNSKFVIGKNIAATKGKVVYKNSIIELIHYNPLTDSQYEIPLLIIPPFINKYYIMDLQEENSFVKWLLEQNYNVFLISWINPDESLTNKDFSDYVDEGILAALDYLTKILKFNQVNALGYCIGGTLLATTLAYMKCNNDNRIKSASFLTTLIDFENAGDLSIFIDDHFVNEVEKYMKNIGGYVEGKDIGNIFNLLRPNDMIWPFYINNYLLGKESFPFDILYWNEDSTRIPMTLHLFYLNNMYKNNLLKIPGGITIHNKPIDIAKVDIPCFSVATKADHIVPWNNSFISSQLFSGEVEFVLADSGHVAGIINHPNQNKYRYWTNNVTNLKKPTTSEAWFNSAKENQGSWWTYWNEWENKNSGSLQKSQSPEEINPNIIEDAPGSYVKIKY